MKNKASDQFLLWTYFKIDGSEGGLDIVKVAIEKAYVDATTQGAYKTIVAKGYDQAKIKDNAVFTVFSSLHSLNDEKDFLDWHKETCSQIVKVFKSVKTKKDSSIAAFTYGNAQKLLNMSIKNLYIIKYCYRPIANAEYNYDGWYDSRLKPFESQFQIPLDNYILQYLFEDIKNNNSHCGKAEGITIKRITSVQFSIHFRNGKEYPWSKLPDYRSYHLIQEAIMNYYKPKYPLEWENEIWISIAKKRK